MRTLSESPSLRLITLCILYVAQGVPFGFVTITLVAYLTKEGVPVGQVGAVTGIVSVPWTFKFVWGPFIDRFGIRVMGRRRPWILFAQTMMALTIGSIIFIPDLTANIGLLVWLVGIHNVFSSIQDVSTDALAVDLLEEKERGRASGFMYGCSYLGAFIGGGVMKSVQIALGMQMAFVVLVLVLFVIMMFPFFLLEKPGDLRWPGRRGSHDERHRRQKGEFTVWQIFANLWKAINIRSAFLLAIACLSLKIAIGGLPALSAALLQNTLGWSEEDYAWLMSFATWFGLGGSVVGGFVASLIGAKRLACIATILLGLTWLGFALAEPYWNLRPVVIAYSFAEPFFYGVLAVSTFALAISISWPVIAATQFTAYMSLQNLSNSIGGFSIGWFNQHLSVPMIFVVAGIFQCLLCLAFFFIDPGETRRALGEGDLESQR